MNTRIGPDLRAMVWKETKENARWAVLAMIGIALALVFTIAHQMGGNETNSFSAVWGSVGLVMTFGAPVVGLALGLLQILPELRRDQWAFLVHRPAPRATLFWGKVLAGTGLTVAATLIPLLALALWARAPGHIAAPFDPRLLLGGLAAILTGLVFHAAGLLTALRPARWYGSRALPVASAIVCALLVTGASEFLEAVLVVALFLAVLETAARGSFLTTGHYGRQPRPAKFSLGLTAFVGLVAAIFAAIAVIGSTISTLFPPRQSHRIWTGYEITRTGHILRVTGNDSDPLQADDLSGRPVVLPPSANTYNFNNFLQEQPLFQTQRVDRENFSTSKRYATLLGTAGFLDKGAIWYYVPSQQQVFAYSLQSRRLLGILGPSGFRANDSSNTLCFTGPLFAIEQDNISQTRTLLAFPHALYLLRTDAREVIPLLMTTRRISDVDKIDSYYGGNSPNIGVAYVITAGDQFSVFSPDGQALFTLPREHDRRTYPNISVAMTPDRRRFFFHYGLGWRGEARYRLPSLITEVTADGAIVRRDVLPPLPTPPSSQPPLAASLFGLLSPSVATAAANAIAYFGPHSDDNPFWSAVTEMPRLWMWFCVLSVLSGLLCADCAWRIGRRCVFTRHGQWAWAAGVFWLGLPGLLLLLSLRDWPARESCPNCGRPRVVDRDLCEHCGAVFAVPPRDGTEIFEDSTDQAPTSLATSR